MHIRVSGMSGRTVCTRVLAAITSSKKRPGGMDQGLALVLSRHRHRHKHRHQGC